MKSQEFNPETDGFYGVYYPCPRTVFCTVIAMTGDSCKDHLARSTVRWLHSLNCNVLAVSPAEHDYSLHNYPLEQFEKAIRWLRGQGNKKIGILGASSTGNLALLAASCYDEISLTLALSPSDFVMEGYYQENGTERPGDQESTVSYQGKPLPYLPYAYRHPEYNERLKKEARLTHNRMASRQMFDLSELFHPVTDRERIKVEKIRGTLVLIGAEDDVLWDTCKYIRRMTQELKRAKSPVVRYSLIYDHGTHFLFPQSMMNKVIPVGSSLLVSLFFQAGRNFPEECRRSRIDLDRRLRKIIKQWQDGNTQ